MLTVHIDGTPSAAEALRRLCVRGEADFARVEAVVREIIDSVRKGGDAAVRRYAAQFEPQGSTRWSANTRPLLLREFDGKGALDRLSGRARDALELSAERIRDFHEHCKEAGFRYTTDGITLGMRVTPVRRAAVYAPGGKARYPSSVLMAAIPARVAGVPEVIVATPLSGNEDDDPIFAAAHLAGVSAIVDAGGAQAIAALAYGTETIPRVDKIVGPGNIYVACAKRLVFGAVSIDGIAGPSEILILADDESDPRLVAADLISQAEHDEAAYPLLVCASDLFAYAVDQEIALQLKTLPRARIARASFAANGHAFVVSGRARMAQVADELAAEHLSLHVTDPEAILPSISRAGAAFLGALTPEAAGDYLAGPSHVLPTGGAVRFGSPLGIYDFVTRTSLIRYSAEALARHAPAICVLGRLEGLEGHARAVEARTETSGAFMRESPRESQS
jgi:histidinol dehydrogenase